MKRSSALDWLRSPLLPWFITVLLDGFELGYCWGLWRYEHALFASEPALSAAQIVERIEALAREKDHDDAAARR